MTDMLEKAARAAADADAKLSNGPSLYANNPDVYTAIARAVLLAIREPDEDIKGKITVDGWVEGELKYDEVWQGTIDAILAQPSTPTDVTPA